MLTGLSCCVAQGANSTRFGTEVGRRVKPTTSTSEAARATRCRSLSTRRVLHAQLGDPVGVREQRGQPREGRRRSGPVPAQLATGFLCVAAERVDLRASALDGLRVIEQRPAAVVTGAGAGAVTVRSIVVPGCVTVRTMVTGLGFRFPVADRGGLVPVAAAGGRSPPPLHPRTHGGG